MISQRSFTELHADLASGPNDDVSQADFMRKFHDYQQSHREQQDKLQV
jgi:hypothetical protein